MAMGPSPGQPWAVWGPALGSLHTVAAEASAAAMQQPCEARSPPAVLGTAAPPPGRPSREQRTESRGCKAGSPHQPGAGSGKPRCSNSSASGAERVTCALRDVPYGCMRSLRCARVRFTKTSTTLGDLGPVGQAAAAMSGAGWRRTRSEPVQCRRGDESWCRWPAGQH